MARHDEQLALLVAAVQASAKYRDVSPDLIVSIGTRELHKRRNLKEAIKATKNVLHQVSAAYFDTRERYGEWLSELRTAASENKESLLQACAHVMSFHASTRERLPILDEFYRAIFAHLPPVETVLDIACGLNPLALPWMPLLAEGTRYYAYDISQQMMDFLGAWLSLNAMQGGAQICDVLQACPSQRGDVALLLKAIPCLEHIDSLAVTQLLHELNVDYLVVSFPSASLGGKSKGMLAHYEAHFRQLVQHETWAITRLEFRSELVFIVQK